MLVGVALGLAVGGLAGWGLGRLGERTAGPQAEAAAARAHAGEQAERLVRATAELDGERRLGADRIRLFEQAEHTLREAFASVSADALRANNQSFLQLAKTSLSEFQQQAAVDLDHRQRSIDGLVKPLQETLGQVNAKLQEVETERASSQAQMREQLQTLATATTHLERALQTPHVRGAWGEVQLRRVVELAGMIDHCTSRRKPPSRPPTASWCPIWW